MVTIKTRKFFKMTLLIICGIIFIVILILLLFLNTSREYGGKASKEKKESFNSLPNYIDGNFQNLTPTSLSMSFPDYFSVAFDFIKGAKK